VSPQLEELDRQFQAVSDRARDLSVRAGSKFATRPAPDRWSIVECLDHLRISSEAFFPILNEAFAEARNKRVTSDSRYKLDFFGKLLIWTLEPPSKFRIPAPPGFHPSEVDSSDRVLSNFLASQGEVRRCLHMADGLAIDKMKIRSPFDKRVRYSIWSAFCAAVSHQRRHLWQAEKTLQQF
jgi:hypothetical protein